MSAVRMPEAKPQSRKKSVLALVAYYVVLVTFIALAAGTVTIQVFAAGDRGEAAESCRAGLYGLVRAVDRARDAASDTPGGNEDAALARFRSALDPEWQRRDATAAACGTDRWGRDAL